MKQILFTLVALFFGMIVVGICIVYSLPASTTVKASEAGPQYEVRYELLTPYSPPIRNISKYSNYESFIVIILDDGSLVHVYGSFLIKEYKVLVEEKK
jgi:hypothetical protein